MERVDLWITRFRPIEGETPEEGLQRIFGIDDAAAENVVASVPCAVKRGVDRARIPVFLRALDAIGALVEVREHVEEAPDGAADAPPVSLGAPALGADDVPSLDAAPARSADEIPTDAPPATAEAAAPPIDLSGGLDIDPSEARPSFDAGSLAPGPAPAAMAAPGLPSLDPLEDPLSSGVDLPGLDLGDESSGRTPTGIARRSFPSPSSATRRAPSGEGVHPSRLTSAAPGPSASFPGADAATSGIYEPGGTIGTSGGFDPLDVPMDGPLELDLDEPPPPPPSGSTSGAYSTSATFGGPPPEAISPEPPALQDPEEAGRAIAKAVPALVLALLAIVLGLFVVRSLLAPDLESAGRNLDAASPEELEAFRAVTPEARDYFFETEGARLTGMTSAETREFVNRLYFTGAVEVLVPEAPEPVDGLMPPVPSLLIQLPGDPARRLAIENAYWQRVSGYASRTGTRRQTAAPLPGITWWTARIDFGQR